MWIPAGIENVVEKMETAMNSHKMTAVMLWGLMSVDLLYWFLAKIAHEQPAPTNLLLYFTVASMAWNWESKP